VERGDIYGFLGPNGAGKTTTIRMLLGLVRAQRGRIAMFGTDVRRGGAPLRARVGAHLDVGTSVLMHWPRIVARALQTVRAQLTQQ